MTKVFIGHMILVKIILKIIKMVKKVLITYKWVNWGFKDGFRLNDEQRNVYSAFSVHIFDLMTDILVISQWYNAENDFNNKNTIDHVDSRLMSY